jgi:hypothetical protein
VALVALYALAGFLMAPRLLRSALIEDIPKTLGVTPQVGEIHINPFPVALEIKDFSLAAPAGDRLLGFGRLFVDFGLVRSGTARIVRQHRNRRAMGECDRSQGRRPQSPAAAAEDSRRKIDSETPSRCRDAHRIVQSQRRAA